MEAARLSVVVEALGISKIRREVQGLDRDLDQTGKRGSKALGVLGAVGKGALLGVGAAALYAAPKIIGLASDAEETASKFRIVFGPAAAEATKQLNAFSVATGTSKFALIEQAAQFQALIRPMGLTTQNAANMSVGITKLATDLASFNNTSVQEAMTALQSGLVGEAEPLRRFGVQLSENRVKAFAYANGIAKVGADLTTAEKAQARYQIILKDTNLAQGDATRTAGSFANQFKRLKNQVTDLATELGIVLLPAVMSAVKWINNAVTEMRTGTGEGGKFARVVGDLAAAVGWAAAVFAKCDRAVDAATSSMVNLAGKIGDVLAPHLRSTRDLVRDIAEFLGDVVRGAKDAVHWVGKIKIPDLTLDNPFSGGRGNGTTVGPGLMGRPANVDGFNGIAARFGNVLTSGYRPGDPGWHGQNRARDYAGGNMMGFARYMLQTFGASLLELIHTPLGIGIKNGQVVPISFFGPAVMADHYDHVHVAMRGGGKVPGSGAGDRVPAMLEPGEFVMRRSIVDRFGPTFFAGLNGMKAGGPVGGPTLGSMQWAAEAMEGALALAKLTPDIADDLEWLRKLESTYAAIVKKAGKRGKWDLVSRFAPQLTSTQGAIDELLKPQGPSATDFLDRDTAMAGLTAGTDDDLAAAKATQTYWQEQLRIAQGTADPRDDTEAARALQAATSAVEALTSATEQANRLQAQRDQINTEIVENQRRLIALAGQGDQIVAAVIAAVNGGIGGRVGLGFQSVGYAGGVANY